MNNSPVRNRIACIVGFLLCLLAAGCVRVERATPQSPSQPVPVQVGPVAPEPPENPAQVAPVASQASPVQSPPAPVNPVSAPAPTVVRAPATGAPIPSKPVAKAPATPSAAIPESPAPTPRSPRPIATAPVVVKAPTQAPLDLGSLEKRLRETKAIGVFTKISLKNQVDDLVDKFRAYYQGRAKTTLAELRRPYDLLLMKVLSLLQDSDPPLAQAIVASREAIWGILADPKKFSESKLMAGEAP